MYENYPVVGEALKRIFFAEILAVIASIFSSTGLVSMMISLVGLAFSLTALGRLASLHPSYKNAFQFTVATILISIIHAFVSKHILIQGLLSIVSAALSVLIVYSICNATAFYLTEKGAAALAAKANVWKLYAALSLAFVICTFLLFIPILNVMAMVIMLLAGIILVAASILYLVFLYQSYKTLLN